MTRRMAKGSKCSTIKNAPKWMLVLAAAVVAAMVAALAFFFYKSTQGSKERYEEPQKSFVFLHMSGCGWCEKFKPTWAEFTSTYGGALSDARVKTLDIDSTSPDVDKYREHVTGYPTILFVDGDDKVTKFTGERTVPGLVAFLGEQGVTLDLKGKAGEGFLPNRPETGAGKALSEAGSAANKSKPDEASKKAMGDGAGFSPGPL